MNSLRYRGKTWKVGDFVYNRSGIFHRSHRLGHILKLFEEECQNVYSVGLFRYEANVIWQNGEIHKISLDYLELVNE